MIIDATGAMDTATLQVRGYGEQPYPEDPSAILIAAMGVKVTNEGIRCYVDDGTSASDTWLDVGIFGINCKPAINGFYIDDQGYVCQRIRSDT